MLFSERRRVVDLAARHRLPSMTNASEFVILGGLISYGANLVDLAWRAAVSVDTILKGAKPADLPVEQPEKFELVINLQTAKALGLTIPRLLLLQADQVIEQEVGHEHQPCGRRRSGRAGSSRHPSRAGARAGP
jgi:putative tryptophan/tyrosine transport system substrate-binding protein